MLATPADKEEDKIEEEKAQNQHSEEEEKEEAPVKTKVYLPKPIRVFSVFSRTSSYDSLATGSSSIRLYITVINEYPLRYYICTCRSILLAMYIFK